MKAKYIFLFLLLSNLVDVALGQTLKIIVKSNNEEVSFARVEKDNKLFSYTDSNGICEIYIADLQNSQAIKIIAFSFLPYEIIITKDILKKKEINIELEPEVYRLDEVLVIPVRDDLKLFENRINRGQEPFLSSEFKELRIISKPNKKIHYNWSKRRFNIDTVNCSLTKWETKLIKSILKLNFTIPLSFIRKKERKNFSCQFLGKEESGTVWKFIIERKKKKYKMEKNDDSECIVYLDSNGFISRLKTQMKTNNKSSSSYFLDTHFTRKENVLIAKHSLMQLVPLNKNIKNIQTIEVDFTWE